MDSEEWMGPPMPDGAPYYRHQGALPVVYYSGHPSPDGLSGPEGAHLPAHSQNLPADPRTAFAHPTSLGQLPPEASQTHHQTLMSPSVSSCGDASSPWSAPDAETDFDGYSYHGSPLSAGVPATYNQAPLSPASWSSPMQMPFRQVDEQQQPARYQPRMCSPASNGSPHAMAQTMYAHTSHPLAPTPEADESEGGDGGRSHNPYSDQIRRALLSFEGHAATVQQIYEWFRENTNRDEHTGWQNSIRHNLSLNDAFTKCQRPVADGEDASAAKRGNVWRLEEWGEEGVLSTAKYRPKNKGGRARARRDAGVSGRRSSGHRGGCATSRMKRRRQSQQGGPGGQPAPSPPPPPQGDFAPGHWGAAMPAREAGAPLTPESSTEEFAPLGAGMMSFSVPQFGLPQYQISDVAGVWDGGRLFADDFRGLRLQEPMQ